MSQWWLTPGDEKSTMPPEVSGGHFAFGVKR
jgi:hypothetical protein